MLNQTSNKPYSIDVGNGIARLVRSLCYFHPVSPEIAEYLTGRVTPCFFRKKKLLLKEGSICDHVYFIIKGAVRGYIKEGVRDVTTWITIENEMVTSISGLEIQAPSIENIQAIEDSELLAITYQDIEELYIRFPEFNIVIRKLLQHYYGDAERRAFIARLHSADNKYKHFLDRHSHLANRIPLTYIASFLGMRLETLSKVRKRLAEEQIKKRKAESASHS